MSLGGSGSLLATRVLQRGRQREPKQPLSDKMRKIAFLGIQSCHENRMRIDSTPLQSLLYPSIQCCQASFHCPISPRKRIPPTQIMQSNNPTSNLAGREALHCPSNHLTSALVRRAI